MLISAFSLAQQTLTDILYPEVVKDDSSFLQREAHALTTMPPPQSLSYLMAFMLKNTQMENFTWSN